jgi:hypothetical protein
MFNDTITSETITLNSDAAPGTIVVELTETGNITGSVTGDVPAPEPPGDTLAQYAGEKAPQSHDFHGETPDGAAVTITDATTGSDYTESPDGQLTSIRPATVTFDSAPDTPFVEQDITVTFDMLIIDRYNLPANPDLIETAIQLDRDS